MNWVFYLIDQYGENKYNNYATCLSYISMIQNLWNESNIYRGACQTNNIHIDINFDVMNKAAKFFHLEKSIWLQR